MPNVFDISPAEVVNPRELGVHVRSVAPNPDANTLFIYTGTLMPHPPEGLSSTGDIVRLELRLNLSLLHNRKFDGNPYSLAFDRGRVAAAPVASLASVKAAEGDILFAADSADVEEDNQDLRLLVDVAVSGEWGWLLRVSYQVNVLAIDHR